MAPAAPVPSVSYAKVVRKDADVLQPEPAEQQQQQHLMPPSAEASNPAAEVDVGEEHGEEGEDESFMTVTSKKEKVKNKVDRVK